MLLSHCHCFSAPSLLPVDSTKIIAAGIMGDAKCCLCRRGQLAPVRVLEPKRALPPRKSGNFLFTYSLSPSPSQVAYTFFFPTLYFDLGKGALYSHHVSP